MRLIVADKVSKIIYKNVPAPYEDSKEAKEERSRIIEEALTAIEMEPNDFCSCGERKDHE